MLMAASAVCAQEPVIMGDVINGHTDDWYTTAIGIWQMKPSGSFEKYATWPTIYGNCGALYKDGIYYVFYGREKQGDSDPGNYDTEYGNQEQEIVVRKFDATTYDQLGEDAVYAPQSNLSFTDMTYDPIEDEVYVVYQDIRGTGDDAFSGYRFGTLDLETMTITTLLNKYYPVEVRALAAHPNGHLYAIDYSGYLYTVNKHNGELTQVGFTGHRNQRAMQSMVADWNTGKLYFAGFLNDGTDHSREGNRYGTGLYEVNIETGAATLLFKFPKKEQVVGLYIQGQDYKNNHDLRVRLNAPVQLVAGTASAFTVSVKNLGRQDASAYTVNLFVGGKLVASQKVNETLAAGATATFDLVVTPTVLMGSETEAYAVVDYVEDEQLMNNTTEAVGVYVLQSCLPTVSLMGMMEGKSASLAWDAPATDAAYTETFERYAPFIIDGLGEWTTVNAAGKQATVTMNSWEGPISYPNAGSAFAYQVFNPAKAGLDAFYWEADTCTYHCQSGSQMLMAAVGVVPANNSNGYEYVKSNDWLISPELSGKAQTISFYAKGWTSQVKDYFGQYNHYTEKFRVLYSTTDREMDSFTLLADTTESTMWFLDGAFTYDLPEGAKYFAIQCVTDGNEGFFFYLDDITYVPAAPHLMGYNVYRDGVKLNAEPLTTTDFTDAEASGSYAVTAVYAEGESVPSNLYNTGINAVRDLKNHQHQSTVIYDLSGRRVIRPAHGIYIVGGKKVGGK